MIKNKRVIIQDIRKGKQVIFTKEMAEDVTICAELIKVSPTYYPLFSTEIKESKRILQLLGTKKDCWLQLPYIPNHCITFELLKSFVSGNMKGFFEYLKTTYTKNNQYDELLFFALEQVHKEEAYFHVKENTWITNVFDKLSKRELHKYLKLYPYATIVIASLPYEISQNYVSKGDVLPLLHADIGNIVWIDKDWYTIFTNNDYQNLLLVNPDGYDYLPSYIKKKINIEEIRNKYYTIHK